MQQVTSLCFFLCCLFVASWAFQAREVPANYLTFEPELSLRHTIMPALATPKSVSPYDPNQSAIDFFKKLCGEHTEWKVTDSYSSEHNGVRHVYLRQMHAGLEITNSHANINFDKYGRVINAGDVCFTPVVTAKDLSLQPILSPLAAVHAIAVHLDLADKVNKQAMQLQEGDNMKGNSFVAVNTGFTEADVPLNLALVQTAGGKGLVLTWHMVVQLVDYWFDVQVDASSGKVVSLIDWVKWDAYDVYAIPDENPLLGPRQYKVNPADLTSSPRGWLDQGISTSTVFTTTAGNNVYAQLNPTGGPGWIYNFRPDGNVNRTFDFDINFFAQPFAYKEAATTNLFYWNNIMHDIFYLRGFTEAAGNFQENNFNKGGAGTDAVYANAQDGSGFNNANMATPPDGQRPRMRMYLWNQVVPYIDGDLDSGIIVHEYGHGISIRLTGGPSNVNCLGSGQAGGMGEGWGDWWSVILLMKREYRPGNAFPMGEYAAGRGIRPFPYSADFTIDPQTYGYINRAGYDQDGNVHAKGSVWCTILNEVYWIFVEKHGFDPDWYFGTGGNNIILQLVVDGLKLQPCNPNFVDARNAILLADRQNYAGRYHCDLWVGFARRGLGTAAVGNIKPVVESFDVPPECQ